MCMISTPTCPHPTRGPLNYLACEMDGEAGNRTYQKSGKTYIPQKSLHVKKKDGREVDSHRRRGKIGAIQARKEHYTKVITCLQSCTTIAFQNETTG